MGPKLTGTEGLQGLRHTLFSWNPWGQDVQPASTAILIQPCILKPMDRQDVVAAAPQRARHKPVVWSVPSSCTAGQGCNRTNVAGAAAWRTVQLLAVKAVDNGGRRPKIEEGVESGIARVTVQRIAAAGAVRHGGA